MTPFDGHVPQLSQRSIGKPAAHETTGGNDQRDADWVAQHEDMAGPFANNGRRYRAGRAAGKESSGTTMSSMHSPRLLTNCEYESATTTTATFFVGTKVRRA